MMMVVVVVEVVAAWVVELRRWIKKCSIVAYAGRKHLRPDCSQQQNDKILSAPVKHRESESQRYV
jgi:hypothetical protein